MSKIDLPRERKVGHLTVLRPSRALTPREFNALPFGERLAMIRGAEGKQKYSLLVEAQDAERLIRQLPAQEIYLLIKELGKEDVPELLHFASTEQITTFIDLDCWKGDLLDGPTALEWLELLAECGEEKILATFHEMEFELLTLVLKKQFTILRGPEDYLDDDARLEAVQRDGGYELEFHDSESEGVKFLAAILEVVFRREHDFYVRLMESVRWEPESLLEEEELRYRSGRLQDLGFPDPFEASSLHAPLDAESFDPEAHRKKGVIPGEATEAPGFILTAARPAGLLAEVLAGGLDSETCWELTFLLNQAMSADRVDVGDMTQVRQETAEAYRYLNLALEHLAGTDVDRASDLFFSVWLQSLYRLGFGLTLQLQRRARKVAGSAVGPYLDGPFRALVEALGHRKPRFFEGIEDPSRGGERAFAELHDIRRTSEWLDRLEAQLALFSGVLPFGLPDPAVLDLSGCAPDQPADLALSDFFLTALANRLLGRPFLPEPIPQAEVSVLHGKVCAGGGLAPGLREETVSWLESLHPGGGSFGEWCLDLWEGEFCTFTPDDLDPRFIGGLIVRLA